MSDGGERQMSDVRGQMAGKDRCQRSEVRWREKTDVRGQKSEVGERQMSDIRCRRMNKATNRINSAKDLSVYKKAYALAMEIFTISKQWPSEEKFSLTDQIRRSSRSVCANLW